MRTPSPRAILLAGILLASPSPSLGADAASPASPAGGAGATFLARANAAAARGDWTEVERVAREWERAAPTEGLPSVALAQALFAQRRSADAVDAARRSLERGETSVARFYLGAALFQLGALREAEREAGRAVELAPQDGPALRGWAGALASLGRYRAAARALERARPLLDPDLAFDDQLVYYRTASAWDFPAAAMEHHGRAGWLLERERWKEAAEAYRAALALAPKFADCRYHLGWALHQLGDDAGAEKEYRAAIAGYGREERGLSADARYNLAQTLVAHHRAREAVPLLREAIEIRGERYWLLHALGNACRTDGDARCAREAWEKLLGSHEQLPEGLLADVKGQLAALGGATEAKEEPALTTSAAVPAAASLRCDHGTVLAEQGRREEARREFEEALGAAPEFGFCRLNLAFALLQSGDAAGAEREIRKALASKVSSAADEKEERTWRARAAFQLAQLLVNRQGPPAEAAARVRDAASVLGETPLMALTLAVACDAAGDRACALAAARRAWEGREQLSEANAASTKRLLGLLGATP